MKKNEFDVPVDWGKLSSHKPAIHSKSDKQIYWSKIRMASKCKLSKEAFIKLAEAYSKQEKYENELKSSVHSLAEKYKIYTGFIGLTNTSDLIMDVALDLLGDDFSYYFYDCNEDFNKFNKNTILGGETHPNVKDFGGLWEFSQEYRDDTK